MLTLYKSLIRSHLEYCCPLWNTSKISDIQQIEGVQRTFTSRIWGVQHLDYWQRLKALNLMSMQRRRERYIIIHMWKIWHQRCPNDLGILFSTPSRHGIKATIPSLSKSSTQRQQSLYDGSFAVMGHVYGTPFHQIFTSLKTHCCSKQNYQHFLNRFQITHLWAITAVLMEILCWTGVWIRQQRCCKGGLTIRWPSRGIYESLQSIQSKYGHFSDLGFPFSSLRDSSTPQEDGLYVTPTIRLL